MRIIPRPRGDPDRYGGGVRRTAVILLLVVPGIAGMLSSPAAGAPSVPPTPPEDTLGTTLMQWTYDKWTVPWVTLRGPAAVLAPASHVTFMVLACESTALERDRLARHLSAEECEHRMAAIRADQDTALMFRLDLRVFDFPGSTALVRLDPAVTFILEDDRGRRAPLLATERGPILGFAAAEKVKRVYGYHPPWVRGIQHLDAQQYDVGWGRSLTVVEHRLRFGRRDTRTGDPLLDAGTRWLRLRVSFGRYEWVAMWPFRDELAGGR